ncbi:MAG: CIA30 family protein [Gramella sp.]|nr:CIA30 family protein [Christiangramia sp.]
MRYFLFSFLFLLTSFQVKTIFDFNSDSNMSGWNVVVDGVMGGLSTGDLALTDEVHGLFTGVVSLENNGGFSSIRYDMPQMDIGNNRLISIRVKGDGKNYQLRVKNTDESYYSYITEFSTNGEWQEIKIPLKEMYPSFRGRRLNKPNFNHDHLDEIAFLIGNKKNETFRLLIDKIELK